MTPGEVDGRQTAALLRTVRMIGRFGWDGGYTHTVLVDDGCVICARCIAPNYRAISWATRHDIDNGWCVVAPFILDDGEPVFCAHCGEELT